MVYLSPPVDSRRSPQTQRSERCDEEMWYALMAMRRFVNRGVTILLGVLLGMALLLELPSAYAEDKPQNEKSMSAKKSQGISKSDEKKGTPKSTKKPSKAAPEVESSKTGTPKAEPPAAKAKAPASKAKDSATKAHAPKAKAQKPPQKQAGKPPHQSETASRPKTSAQFIDRDGDGINDGKEHRFRRRTGSRTEQGTRHRGKNRFQKGRQPRRPN